MLKKPCFSEEDFPPLQSKSNAARQTMPNPRRGRNKNKNDNAQQKDDAAPVGDPRSGTPQVMKITGGKLPQQASPFQALAESIAAVQTNMTDKIEALQTAVNKGISTVKTLITDPTASVEPRVKTLEKYVTNIKKIPNMETRLTKVEKAVQDATENLPLQNMVIQGNTPENTILQRSVVRHLEEVEKKSIVHTNTLDMVVAWAGTMQRAQWSVQKEVRFNTSKHHQNDIVVGGYINTIDRTPVKLQLSFSGRK